MDGLFRVQFLVDDKNVAKARRALIGIARDYHDEPVVNAAPHGKNGVRAVTNGSATEMLAAYLKKNKLKEVTPQDMAAFQLSIGRSKNYSHLLRVAIKARLLRRVRGTPNIKARYTVL
jgi:hypothetical protein